MSSQFLTAVWHRLVMFNYPIEPGILNSYIPNGTELDDFNGNTYISLVAFRFLRTKVMGMSIPFHRDFEEINLRFYVRYRSEDGWRRGVVFVKEVVPKKAIAWVARWLYNENYFAMPTSSTLQEPKNANPGLVEYHWQQRNESYYAKAEIVGEPSYPESGSLEEFITEHYWGYSSQRDGGTVEYQVEHPQWKVWKATQASVSDNMTDFYNAEFAQALSTEPSSVFVADGSPVSVHKGIRIV